MLALVPSPPSTPKKQSNSTVSRAFGDAFLRPTIAYHMKTQQYQRCFHRSRQSHHCKRTVEDGRYEKSMEVVRPDKALCLAFVLALFGG